jgi:ubiquinone/menaquinone biosynthesis C-methylase UbiE
MSRHIRCRTLALLFITLLVTAVAAAQRSGSSITTGQIFEGLALREGMAVCEIGAGDGELSLAAGRAVGAAGRVYASELGDERVKTLQANVARSGLAQITVVAGAAERTNFPDAACDAVFMRNVYHHFADPALMNALVAAALKPGGRFAVVDFRPPGTEAGRPADRASDGMHGVVPGTVARELAEAGFEPVQSVEGTERWFMVVVRRAADV